MMVNEPENIPTIGWRGDLEDVDPVAEVDKKIEDAEYQVVLLKRERNSRLPISRLPVEIFAEIFIYLTPKVSRIPWIRRRWGSKRRAIEWLFFTHVCHAWRTTALNQSSLWTCPDWYIPDLGYTMIERAKHSALHIAITECLGHDILHTIQNQIGRIETLIIMVTDDNYTSALQGFITSLVQPAPRLRSINFHAEVDQKLSFPSHFLALDTPLLKDISLYRCHVPWRSPVLENLTSLVLSGNNSDLPSGQQFLETLRHMPSLHELELNCTAPRIIEGSEVVDLPQLRLLSLWDNSTSCGHVLKHITFPSSAVVKLYCNRNLGGLDPQKPLWSSLAEKYHQRHGTMTAISLYFEIDEFDADLFFEWWNTSSVPMPAHHRFRDHFGPPLLELSLSHSSDNDTAWQADVKGALESVSLASIEVVHIGGFLQGGQHSDDAEGLFTTSFGALLWSSKLTKLSSSGYDWSIHLACALAPHDAAQRGSSSSSRIPFPSLISLSLASFYETSETEGIVGKLLQTLESRKTCGHQLECLTLKNCKGLAEEHVLALKRVVRDVDVV
ncbi:hypothetical protein VNI00_002221 [Paramarasmius palmivorus]|uniref:F-box domain-containing protein n=1 Tax=Paramarasmius palmivorus TaxID=297713 RepID=A0AAW0E4F8_9AGAR